MAFLTPARAPAIRSVYGAEPCLGLHAQLRRRILNSGLDGIYHIVPSGVRKTELLSALEKIGVNDTSKGGIFDTIICVRVLCSVPDPARTIADLYDLLRPGGQFLIVEHVVNPWRITSRKGSFLARVLQIVYSWLGWSFFIGDCHLDRDTTAYLKAAAEKDGGWERIELEHRFELSCLPYISGVLVKRG
jgi:SAM-dependent methyltransferase